MIRKLLIAFGVFLMTGCGAGMKASNPGITPPNWYQNRHEVSAVCGFGTVEYNGDYGLSESSAIDFARDELGKNLKSRTQSYLEAARKAARQNVGGKSVTASSSAQEQFVRTVNDNVVKFSIPKATKLVGEQFFAMVCMDANKYMNELKKNGDAAKALEMGAKQIQEQSSKLDRLLKENK